MDRKYRIAIIGFGHMHINSVGKNFGLHEKTQVVAIADTVPEIPELRSAPYTREWNLDHARELYPDAKVYKDYTVLLEEAKPDLAIVTSEVLYHREVVIACARAGVDVCIEKPMAYNLEDALAMVREVNERGTLLLVNWPVAWNASGREMQRLAADGAIGKVFQMRMREGHAGPLGAGARHGGVDESAAPMTGYERAQSWWHRESMGGGAMRDFCCYGCMLSQWYFGQDAQTVIGVRANLNSGWGDAEDTAAMIIRFPSAIATLEGTWATLNPGPSSGPALYGSEGTLAQGGGGITVYAADGSERLVAPQPLPAGRDNIASEYVHIKTTGEPPFLLLEKEYNLRAMATLDAGLRSSVSGKTESVNSVHWCIG